MQSSFVTMLNAIVRIARVSVHDCNMDWFSFMMLLNFLKTPSRGDLVSKVEGRLAQHLDFQLSQPHHVHGGLMHYP